MGLGNFFTDFLGPIGTAAGGIGSMISGFGGGGGTPMLSPEAQYELQRAGVDIQAFQTGLNALAQQWQRAGQAWDMGMTTEQLEAYNKAYGGAEGAAGEYAQSAFEGKPSAGAQNLIAGLGIQAGRAGESTEDQIIQNALQAGLSLDDPIVQDRLAKAQEAKQSAFLAGSGQVLASDYQNAIANAAGIMQGARSGRIGGTEVPTPPQTPEQVYQSQIDNDPQMLKHKQALAAAQEKFKSATNPFQKAGAALQVSEANRKIKSLTDYLTNQSKDKLYGGAWGGVPGVGGVPEKGQQDSQARYAALYAKPDKGWMLGNQERKDKGMKYYSDLESYYKANPSAGKFETNPWYEKWKPEWQARQKEKNSAYA